MITGRKIRNVVEKIKSAYETTGLKPVFGKFCDSAGDTSVACAIFVLLVANGKSAVLESSAARIKTAAQVLDVSTSFVYGLIHGFDGLASPGGYDFVLGRRAGMRLRNWAMQRV